MIYTVANLKGGVGKTLSTAFLAAGLHRSGRTVVAIDADAQGSLLSWAEAADPEWLTVAMPTKTIHRQVDQLQADDIVIDTPPGHIPIVASAIQAAARTGGMVIVPVQPTTADIDKLPETLALIEDTPGGDDLRVVLLLTRAVKGTRALRLAREALEAQGMTVLQTVIHQSQALAGAHLNPITDLAEYADVLTELQEQ